MEPCEADDTACIQLEASSSAFEAEGLESPTSELEELESNRLVGLAERLVAFAEPAAFERPTTLSAVRDRVAHNARAFAVVYSAVYGIVGVAVIVSDPLRLLTWLLFGSVGFGVVRSYHTNEVWELSDVRLRRREQLMVLVPLAVAIAVFGGLLISALWVVFIGTSLCLGHAVGRRPYTAEPLRLSGAAQWEDGNEADLSI